jgi:hypothetical protein
MAPKKSVCQIYCCTHISSEHSGAFMVVVIAALYRQRARRNHRHIELGEDLSVGGSQLQA